MSDNKLDFLATSPVLTVVARGAMILATICLPIAGYLLTRAVATVDSLTSKVDTIKEQSIEGNGTLRLIQQAQETQGRMIADHENRVRILESSSWGGRRP